MEIAGLAAQLLLCQPLLTKPRIFFLTAAVLPLFSVFGGTLFSAFPALMITFNPFRRRMSHAVGFAVIIIADITVSGFSILIRGDHRTEKLFLWLWRHTVCIHLSGLSVRFSLLIAVSIHLARIKRLPHIKIRTFQRLSCLCTVFFQFNPIIGLKYLLMAIQFQSRPLLRRLGQSCVKPDLRLCSSHIQPSHLHLIFILRLENISIIPGVDTAYGPGQDSSRRRFPAVDKRNGCTVRFQLIAPVRVWKLPGRCL